MPIFLKDDKLAYINDMGLGNIAQYISIDPNGKIKHIQISDYAKNEANVKQLITALIKSSRSGAVNIRSFSPYAMKGNKLVYNKMICDLEEIIQQVQQNCAEGKYSIINENIDINDGGVSGVVLGNIIEFAPKDTPKCVDKEGVCLLEKSLGYHILKTVYGFQPEFCFGDEYRVEFSIHPNREGVKQTHTIVWEYELFQNAEHEFKITWPNKFSKFIGDKTFGLIIADYLGMNVPFTTVIPREVAPFTFGRKTGLFEKWIRTCPIVKEPGKYYSGNQWIDPFTLMQSEESKGDNDINISAILSQDAVDAKYSGGAIITKETENDVIEGVQGNGEQFMLGQDFKNDLPEMVKNELKATMNTLRSYNNLLGDVSIEWVYDNKEIWIVQLNQLKNNGSGNIIVPGIPSSYEKFYVKNGLEALRDRIQIIKNKDIGIEIVGDVGVTSHFGDLLRQSNIPSRIVNASENN
ncbi:hypothetical protein [Desulfosporosinus lacus]|uniref:Uncharacterized protein n=1 Tax=Desulfosporosinus lacus DSM 15449 TaxID=1121420 RepID=A0A1M5X758_9FIRM|nr:hypothetical protein [Desulfosporosinus lacus]SHH95621.1 hypothetical protein SAMN02746098_01830 [Desulfosporosinus lacus DSM 15449]